MGETAWAALAAEPTYAERARAVLRRLLGLVYDAAGLVLGPLSRPQVSAFSSLSGHPGDCRRVLSANSCPPPSSAEQEQNVGAGEVDADDVDLESDALDLVGEDGGLGPRAQVRRLWSWGGVSPATDALHLGAAMHAWQLSSCD